MNLDRLAICSVYIHDVPRGRDEEESIVLTDEPVVLDDQLRQYFRSRIVSILQQKNSIDVVTDDNEQAEVREAVACITTAGSNLAAQSQRIARCLHAVQNALNPAGLLAVISGEIDGEPVVAIMKLERERGVRCHVTHADGRSVISVELLRDLMLTERTKVFKTALLLCADPMDPSSMCGKVSDGQRQQSSGSQIARFFLRSFLGCKVAVNPARATGAFFKKSLEYLNTRIGDREKRGRYLLALTAALQDQQLDVQPADFANRHLDDVDQAEYKSYLREEGVDPARTFQKDLSAVPLGTIQINFESSLVLVGDPRDIKEHVAIRPENAPHPGVDVNNRISTYNTLRGR